MTSRRSCGHEEPATTARVCSACFAEALSERDELKRKVERFEHTVREAVRQNAELEGRVRELSALTVSQGKHFQDAKWKAFDSGRRAERAEAGLSAMAAMRDALLTAHNALAGGHMTGLALADVIDSIDAALSSEVAACQAKLTVSLENVARAADDYVHAHGRGIETVRGAKDRLDAALKALAKTKEMAGCPA